MNGSNVLLWRSGREDVIGWTWSVPTRQIWEHWAERIAFLPFVFIQKSSDFSISLVVLDRISREARVERRRIIASHATGLRQDHPFEKVVDFCASSFLWGYCLIRGICLTRHWRKFDTICLFEYVFRFSKTTQRNSRMNFMQCRLPIGSRGALNKHQSVKLNAFAYVRLVDGHWFGFFFQCSVFSMLGTFRLIFGRIWATRPLLIFESHAGPECNGPFVRRTIGHRRDTGEK